jgi:integrase/recombinase XerD
MATTLTSAVLVPVTPVFSNTERLALAGFLAGYSGLTRQAYELDLRQYAAWCQQHQLRLFAARRADIECFARDPTSWGGVLPSGAQRRRFRVCSGSWSGPPTSWA